MYFNPTKAILLCLLPLYFSVNTLAQKQGNVWAFGEKAGIDFNSGSPVAVQNAMHTGFYAGTASICDSDGKLMFYTNGLTVWDSTNTIMPSGTIFDGQNANEQAAAIVALPENKYYIFSLLSVAGESSATLFYSEVDMSLNGGLGDVIYSKRGIALDDQAGIFGMTTVSGDYCDAWVLVHSPSNDAIQVKAYEVSAVGINTVPVISTMDGFTYEAGSIKVSPTRQKLVIEDDSTESQTVYGPSWGRLELYDFAPATGIVSNRVVLDSIYGVPAGPGSICFSPDGSKLYCAYWLDFGSIQYYYQFDLSLPTLAAIIASKTLVGITDGGPPCMKNGPDGKIYFSIVDVPSYYDFGNFDSLGSINYPNLPGAACGFTTNVVYLLPGTYGTAPLPNDNAAVPPSFMQDTVYTRKDVSTCLGSAVLLQADTPGRHYTWVGDSVDTQTRTVTASGIYIAEHRAPFCKYYIDTFAVSFSNTPTIDGHGFSCPGQKNGEVWLIPHNGDTITYTYTWLNATGNTLHTNTTNKGDTLSGLDTGGYYIKIQTSIGCDTTLAFTIESLSAGYASFTTDTVICVDKALSFQNTSHNITGSTWNFGDGGTASDVNPVHVYTDTGYYTVVLSANDGNKICTDTSEQVIHVKDFTLTLTASDIEVNKGSPVTLQTTATDTYQVIAWEPAALFTDQAAYTQNITIDSEMIFTVIGETDYGCVDTANVQVSLTPVIFVPSAFTPNGDGRNDVFRPVFSSGNNLRMTYFKVFDRWGEEVYDGEGNAFKGWDGMVHGKSAQLDVYFYTITVSTTEGKEITKKGDVTLVL